MGKVGAIDSESIRELTSIARGRFGEPRYQISNGGRGTVVSRRHRQAAFTRGRLRSIPYLLVGRQNAYPTICTCNAVTVARPISFGLSHSSWISRHTQPVPSWYRPGTRVSFARQ